MTGTNRAREHKDPAAHDYSVTHGHAREMTLKSQIAHRPAQVIPQHVSLQAAGSPSAAAPLALACLLVSGF